MKITNFFNLFIEHYEKTPNKTALIFYPETDHPKTFTFKEIYKRVASLQKQIISKGVKKKSRVILLAEPDENFYFLSLALIALGATPVFLEAKKENLIKRLNSSSFDFILLDPKIKLLKYIATKLWFKPTFSLGTKSLGITQLKKSASSTEVKVSLMKEDDPLLISFTTGSTGEQKAADRNYSISYHQYRVSMKYWIHNKSDIDLTFFPNILLQNLSSGVTTLAPKMRVQDLKDFPFHKVPKIIEKYKVTRLSSPPGYLNELCDTVSQPLTSLQKVISGGATVNSTLAKKTLKLFPNAECNIVYGSTEAEPISSFNMKDLTELSEINVGLPVEEIDIRIDLQDSSDFGEILIAGPHVVKRYLNNSIDNSIFKTTDSDGRVWHHTGDIGQLNSKGELILKGRKKYAFDTKKGIHYSLEIENTVSLHLPKKNRCALVKKGQSLIFVIETNEESNKEILENAAKKTLSTYFHDYDIHFIKRLPVDSRHHWKIEYNKLLKKLNL